MPSLLQLPAPGDRQVCFVGDRIRLTLQLAQGHPWPEDWRGVLRTNLGRADTLRRETIASVEDGRPSTLASWRDIPLRRDGSTWFLDLPLAEVGWFSAKAYAIDRQGWTHWPSGPDFGVSVQPNWCRTANSVYCAWPRMFGPTKSLASTANPRRDRRLKQLDAEGYTVIPASGKLRDLIRELPHIFETLGCRVLHLLPVHPTPTTFARFGRFGSPYACQDLLAIDPALVEFDRRTTGVDQFCELADAVHGRGGRLFLDVVINHTGWGSKLQESRPGWFLRDSTGHFVSPGAWGTTWEDLVELNHEHAELRRHLAEVLLEWCRRGVDGFRCDAGYKVPVPVWEYLVARVRQEFPDTVFLLEGLGGAWEATEALLTLGGMQWAYSELFQNYDGVQVQTYLDHAIRETGRSGLLIHYSETHDNPRLAEKGRAWSLLRNRLCALVGSNGAFGFTCGVEWLAPERVNVHSSRGLNWGGADNLVSELARLNRVLANHPCFFDGAKMVRVSSPGSPIYAIRRETADGRNVLVILINTDVQNAQTLRLSLTDLPADFAPQPKGVSAAPWRDLLGQATPKFSHEAGFLHGELAPAAVFCLAAVPLRDGEGDAYRQRRAAEALVLTVLARHVPVERLAEVDLTRATDAAERDFAGFLGAVGQLSPGTSAVDLASALSQVSPLSMYSQVVTWRIEDARRLTPIPPDHWLLIEDAQSFRASLTVDGDSVARHAGSVPINGRHLGVFPPRQDGADATLCLNRFTTPHRTINASLRYLEAWPGLTPPDPTGQIALLTNGIGGMARLGIDFGNILSKYDCLLAANLHARFPVDRHVFAKRARVWINADGFISPLNRDNLVSFSPGPPARWSFLAHAGDGRTVPVHLEVGMVAGANTTLLRFHRPEIAPSAHDLPPTAEVRLTLRVDIEDRNFHAETKRNGGAEHHFRTHVQTLSTQSGFAFVPAADRRLRVWSDSGRYHPQPEWCENVPHPVEASRGQVGEGDAFSPGWFELPLDPGSTVSVSVSASTDGNDTPAGPMPATPPAERVTDAFTARLTQATRAFVVRRDDVKTVIAGYPWFLDWGRDTLICARGLVTTGKHDEVRQLLEAFGRFEAGGTLPNILHGDNASNRDTSDAPLWYGVVCEELAEAQAGSTPSSLSAADTVYSAPVDAGGRTVADVLRSIATGYLRGTPNGIKVDRNSGLVWSPSHFTWMDTNYPAGTPREGYPIEIQALWIRLLRQLERQGIPPADEPWGGLADRALASLEARFWIEASGWYADVLIARRDEPAAMAVADQALRSNCLWPIALGLFNGDRARRCVLAARRHLLVPGALRSLAPLPALPPLTIRSADGRLLNDPVHPYWGHYEGDEDTRRKPAYHNGTAWVWTLPSFCEALAAAWEMSPAAMRAARAYLGSVDRLLASGCVGHLPEILDGDLPHRPRGCDAQAWSATECVRVARRLALESSP
ncbi:MAG: amylo-alpha-1,6-glucosidase [Limisphaerales bacterium]